jgi:hypothetical protein
MNQFSGDTGIVFIDPLGAIHGTSSVLVIALENGRTLLKMAK